MPQKQELDVAGRKVLVSNLDKVLYPAAGFTKGQVIDYYVRVSAFLLPHLKDRPVTLVRYPDGITGQFFYEKNAPKFTPDWITTVPVPRRTGGRDIRYIVINDLPTLVWCANLAGLEIHPFLHKAAHIDRPTSIVFDLDPGEGTDILDCAEIAFLVKDLLEKWKLKSYPKVSGSKGLQVYVPLNTELTYEVTRRFANAIAELLAHENPKKVLPKMTKLARKGKVFIDWSQNSDFKTTIGVYSLRAKRDPPFVSMPVTWDELKGAKQAALQFQPDAALERLQKTGDLFAPVLKLKQKIPKEARALVGKSD